MQAPFRKMRMTLDYSLVRDLLDRTAPDISPALLHGVLSGFVCSGGEFDAELLPQLLQVPVPPIVGELAEGLASRAREALASEDFVFEPLLPDDDSPLGERLGALGHWCDWFASGFAAGFMRPDSDLGADMCEILDDFAQVAAADQFESDANSQDEQDFMELVEYVRIGSIALFRHCSALPSLIPTEPDSHAH